MRFLSGPAATSCPNPAGSYSRPTTESSRQRSEVTTAPKGGKPLGEGGKSPLLGRVTRTGSGPWFDVSLRLPPGSPVLDGEARLVGVVTTRRTSSSRVAALASIRAQLGRPP